MLDSMRRHANSWVFSLLFAVIIFVFAVNFGPWAGSAVPATLFAVEVNGRGVSMAEFQVQYDNRFAQYQRFFPNLTREQAEAQGFSRGILDSLVQRELLAQLAESYHLTVSDEELRQYLKQYLAAGQDIDKEAYERWVSSTFHVSTGEFEAQRRRDLLAERMQEIIVSGVVVGEGDLKTSYVLKNDQVSLDFIRIDPEHFQGKDKEEKLLAAQKYATDIVQELKAGKKLEDVKRPDLSKKEKGAAPTASDVAPVFGTTELFARNAPSIPGFGYSSPEVLSASFELGSANKAVFTEQPIVANGKLYVLSLKARKPADMASFEKEKTELREQLMREREQAFFAEFMGHLKKTAKPIYNPMFTNVNPPGDQTQS